MTNRVVQRTHHFLALGSHIRHVNQDVDRIELLILDLLDKLCKLVIGLNDESIAFAMIEFSICQSQPNSTELTCNHPCNDT